MRVLVTKLLFVVFVQTTLSTLAFALALLAMGCSIPTEGGPDDVTVPSTSALRTAAETDVPVAEDGSTCTEPGRYTVLDNIVVDRAHDARVWERWVSERVYTHEEAIAYCASLKLGRQTPWRLPTVYELNTLKLHPPGIKDGPETCSPSIDQKAFPRTPPAEFWTSTMRREDGATYVGFDDGRNHGATRDTPMRVRCVTDP